MRKARLALLAFLLSLTFVEPLPGQQPGEINRFSDPADRAHIDQTIKAFMGRYQIPGLSIALADQDAFLLVKAYGVANRKKQTPVTPAHRFRIASLAKPITAVTVLSLVEQDALAMDQRVFGPQGLFGALYDAPDPFAGQVTIQHLLQHGSGEAWTNDGDDPMFRRAHYTHRQLIQWVLKDYPLKQPPGSGYAYSNFGYCVLGRIIEFKTGRSYEASVKALLGEDQVPSFALGRSNKPHPSGMEVSYYSQEGASPYRFPLERMDSHGGWIATARDLVRFLNHLDGTPKRAPLLAPETFRLMVTPSRWEDNYAMGWNVNQSGNIWHMGGIPGTSSMMARTHDGKCWAILCNSRSKADRYFADLDSLAWDILGGIRSWPDR